MRLSILEKLRHIRRDQWILLLLAGILLAVVSMPAEKGADTQTAQETEAQEEEAAEDGMESAAELERRLEDILEGLDGAGKVKVMVTQKDSGERIVEKDSSSQNRSTQEEGGSDSADRTTAEEDREVTTIYERGSDGSETPYVVRKVSPQIEGVLVLAEGGGDAVVEKNITDAVMALFGLEAHKIKVMKMTERSG